MIEKNEFYNSEDHPSARQVDQMWNKIAVQIKPKKNIVFHIEDMRSFYYGLTAAFLFLFAVIGIYSTAKNIMYEMKPEELKLDVAYRSAINEFEKVVPLVVPSVSKADNMQNFVKLKKEEMHYIDEAIDQIRRDTGNSDLSPLKQMRLRQLYTAKLKVLQEIVEHGDLEL